MNEKITASPSPTTYTMSYSDKFQLLLSRRNATNNAAHLFLHLKPGLRVLDFGCGPGTISMGLAKTIEPGELHGVDMEASQVEMIQAVAQAGGHRNMTFQTCDVAGLPFDDDYFGAAHCCAVLLHIPDTQAALAEIRRVLKPGGPISNREMIGSSTLFEPVIDDFDVAW